MGYVGEAKRGSREEPWLHCVQSAMVPNDVQFLRFVSPFANFFGCQKVTSHFLESCFIASHFSVHWQVASCSGAKIASLDPHFQSFFTCRDFRTHHFCRSVVDDVE